MISPDIFSVHKPRKQQLVLWKTIFFNQFDRLPALYEIKPYSVERHSGQVRVNIPHISEIGLEQYPAAVFARQHRIVYSAKQLDILIIHILHKRRLVKLYPRHLIFGAAF